MKKIAINRLNKVHNYLLFAESLTRSIDLFTCVGFCLGLHLHEMICYGLHLKFIRVNICLTGLNGKIEVKLTDTKLIFPNNILEPTMSGVSGRFTFIYHE